MRSSIHGLGLLWLVLVAALAPPARAQTPPAAPSSLELAGPWGSHWRLEGSERVRGEFWSYFDTAPDGPVPNSDYSFLGNRLQLGLHVTRDPFEAFVQLQDSLVWPVPEKAAGPGGQYWFNSKHSDPLTSAIFRQGWFRWRDTLAVPGLSTTLGRQLYRDGLETAAKDPTLAWLQRSRIAERLIGPFDYTHVGRSFDGGQVAWERDLLNVTAMGFVPTAGGYEIDANREIPNIALAGLALNLRETPIVPRTIGRLFYLYYDDHRPIAVVDNRPLAVREAQKGEGLAIQTIGADAAHVEPLGPGRADALAWGALQYGDWQAQKHSAWAFALEAGYQLPDVVLRPWLRVGANLASGDTDPNDDTHGTFFQLLPTARTYAQFPFFNMMNDTDLFGQLLLQPHPMVGIRSDFHWLRLTSSRDFLYAGGGATSQHAFGYSGTPSGGRNDVAFLSDVGLTFTPCTWFTAYAYYGHAFGQEVIRQAFVSPGADYGYVEMTFSF